MCLYRSSHFSWGLLALLFLAPDLFLRGYLVDARWGAAFYNLVHTYVGPVALLLLSIVLSAPQLAPFGLIWLAHLGFDRMLGLGLKYSTFFKDTHLSTSDVFSALIAACQGLQRSLATCTIEKST